MASDFSRTLALLRREKRISQRTAAGDLQVSQALLSHYENGLREPGLAFVVRAADYFGVSCDYLLGRSLSRDGSRFPTPEASEATLESDSLTVMYKKLITDSSTLLLEAASRSGSTQLMQEISTCLSVAIYKLFRYLYQADGTNPDEAFKTKPQSFAALCDALTKLSELRVQCAASGGGSLGIKEEAVQMPTLSLGSLTEQFPQEAQSLLTILQNISEKLEQLEHFQKK
jgi:transcriptional regulator with XRE-family HTH domain